MQCFHQVIVYYSVDSMNKSYLLFFVFKSLLETSIYSILLVKPKSVYFPLTQKQFYSGYIPCRINESPLPRNCLFNREISAIISKSFCFANTKRLQASLLNVTIEYKRQKYRQFTSYICQVQSLALMTLVQIRSVWT